VALRRARCLARCAALRGNGLTLLLLLLLLHAAGCAFWRCRLPARSSYTRRVPGCALCGSLRPRRLSRAPCSRTSALQLPAPCRRRPAQAWPRCARSHSTAHPTSLFSSPHDSPLSLALLHVPRSRSLHLRTAFDRPSFSLQLTLHTCRRRRRSRLASLLATHTFPGPTHNTHSQVLCIRALSLSLASRACLAASSLTRPTACSERALYFCSLSSRP
jgi:hypothetical protein